MGFNERTHAAVAVIYYRLMQKHLGDFGTEVFRYGTRTYAEQRGRRMAKRALRDGQPLTYASYCAYSEWMPTQEMTEANQNNQSTILPDEKDLIFRITRCPWHLQFASMGEVEGGKVYCSDLDVSICRGFQPEVHYETTQTLHDHDCCIQIIQNEAGTTGIMKQKERTKNFEYHTAHLFWTYAHLLEEVKPDECEDVMDEALSQFADLYGVEMKETLQQYCDTDFERID